MIALMTVFGTLTFIFGVSGIIFSALATIRGGDTETVAGVVFTALSIPAVIGFIAMIIIFSW